MIAEGETSHTGLSAQARELLHLRLEDVVPSNTNPRFNLEKEPFEELKKSISKNGLLQPIVVRARGDSYEIIGGHRRFAAVLELRKENPSDKNFSRIAAVVRDVDDALVPVLQLAENINRSDLSPVEVADGIAKAISGGVQAEELAEQLGWTRRNVARYEQLHQAPVWLKEFAKEVKVTRKRVDENGEILRDKKTDRALVDIERHPGLPFSYVMELLSLYDLMRADDRRRLDAVGGDAFRPTAERTVRRIAVAAAVEGWTKLRLRTEIKRARTPQRTAATDVHGEGAPVFIFNERRLTIDVERFKKCRGEELASIAAQLTAIFKQLGVQALIKASSPKEHAAQP